MTTSIYSLFWRQKALCHQMLPYFAALPAASVLLFSGCKPAQRASSDSQIIQEVEAAGSGPVESASVQSLFAWFEQHTHLANQINKQCEQVKKTASATWGDSPEGRVCEAASQTALRHYEP
jgi:hypothetical protein